MTLAAAIAAIEARHERLERYIKNGASTSTAAHEDRATLLRAYRELQERAKAEYDRGYAAGSGDEGHYQRTISELRALNERLLAALNLALTQLIDNDTADTDDLISVGNVIREAIAGAQQSTEKQL